MFGIIESNENNAITLDMRKVLYRTRMHTVILSHALSALPHPYPLRGIIIPRPEAFSDLEELIARVRKAYPALPLALFWREGGGNRYVLQRYADFVYDDNVSSATVIADLLSAYTERSGEKEKRIAGGLCLSRERAYATLFGLDVPYTHAEWMLLFYLLQIHPRAASAEELAGVCFPPERHQSAHNAVSHLSQIRTKTRAFFPATTLIVREGSGYRLFG